jgi:tetratricopeptide (TPR) repeat protein
MLWPARLAFFYPHAGGVLSGWAVAGAVLVLVLASTVALKALPRYPYVAVGWFWYLGTLVPVIGIVQVGLQALADRYTYIPLIGLYLIAAFGVPDLLAGLRARRTVLASLGIIILAVLGVRSWYQVGHWQDSEHLYRHALSVTRNNYMAYKNLGLVLADKGEIEAALRAYASAIAHHPYPQSVYYSAGNALLQIKRFEEAERYYRLALQVQPDYALAYYGLGLEAAQQGRADEALFNYAAAVRYDPGLAEAQLNLGVAYLSQGELAAALQHLQRALAINPFMAQAHNDVGLALVRQGRLDQALQHFQAAVRLKPDYRQARNNLRRVQADRERIATAVANLQSALKSVMAQPEASEALVARMHRRHSELLAALQAFQKALAGRPGFQAENLQNVTGVADVLATYDQFATKKSPDDSGQATGAIIQE